MKKRCQKGKDCPNAICTCGDWKKQHDPATGQCNFRTHGMSFDRKADRCEKFKYAGRCEHQEEGMTKYVIAMGSKKLPIFWGNDGFEANSANATKYPTEDAAAKAIVTLGLAKKLDIRVETREIE